jgi:hypothetical protein
MDCRLQTRAVGATRHETFFFNVLQHKKKIAFCTERGFSWWECLALAEWLKTAHPSPNFSFFYFPVALRSVSVCQSARLKK